VSVFRRRGSESQAIPGIDEPFDREAAAPPSSTADDSAVGARADPANRDAHAARSGPSGSALTGPFDISQVVTGELLRIDFGSLLVPAVDGMQVRLELNEEQQPVAVSVVLEDTVLQLQAFAAPRSEGIWDEIRQEIAEGIRGSQGRAHEAAGPFGRELRADVPAPGRSGSAGTQPVRFIGVDGPRWFLRGLISGPGGDDGAKALAVEEVFRGVAVRRGDLAAPPREPLPISLPEDPSLLTQEPPGGDG